jgi:hypothetical protein
VVVVSAAAEADSIAKTNKIYISYKDLMSCESRTFFICGDSASLNFYSAPRKLSSTEIIYKVK